MDQPKPDRQAALERVKKAEAAVAAALPFLTGRQPTPEERAALKAATEELKAANEALGGFPAEPGPSVIEKAVADLRRRSGR
ncbi:MAG: hypothetical protein HY854_06635 [Burkholderiales bacterium]|nr:hypothetical protein [Burkholderiales bacterium]